MTLTRDDSHTYYLDGIIVPGVTQILEGVGLIDKRFYTTEARDRGSRVAMATELYDTDDLDDAKVLDGDRPYVEAWKRFRDESACEILAIEQKVAHVTMRYAGTLDRRLTMNGRPFIIEIKTGGAEAWHALQTAAYSEATNPNPDFLREWWRAAVYLKDDGKYSLVPHMDPADFDAWLAAVALYHWMENHK